MTILLVEDDQFFRKFYSQKLSENQFTVIIAVNGEEALTAVRGNSVNVILLDLIMPIVDGFSFLEQRQADATIANIPVIVFSTLGQEQDVQKARELGASDYINKSFLDFEALLIKIKEVMKP